MSETRSSSDYRVAAGAALGAILQARPETATQLGDHRFDDRIEDLSLAGLAETARAMHRHRSELSATHPSLLEAEDRVDLAMTIGELDRVIFEIEELQPVTWNPLVYNIGEALYPLLVRDLVPLPDRLRSIAARLELVPERLELARRQLDSPPRVHLETALAQHPGALAMVRDEVDRLVAAEPGLRPLVEPAQQRALDALGAYVAHLSELLEGSHRDPRIGPRLFGRRLALELQSSLAPDVLLERARLRLDEIDEELEAAARSFLGSSASRGRDAVRQALERVAVDALDDDTVLAAAEQALRRCTEAVSALGIVTIPDDPLLIELMPVFRRGVAVAYCDPAGPLEQGGETHLAIAPAPDDWPAEQKASFYREYNAAMLVDLTVHEAMPGHMLQLSHARRFDGSTLVRRVLGSGAFIEGWAVHAEQIMAESGLGGAPVRLQQLKMQLRSTINAMLDVSVHAGGMSEEEALDLMTVRGYQEQGEAQGKWRRACLTSAQLSTYFAGYSELAELFSALGDRLDYDEVLAHGSPPPRLLGELLGVPAG
jgi:uncharacterized protein (DUF885 family)